MAKSQTKFLHGQDTLPSFREPADGNESARWEAYCALQARKRRNSLHAFSAGGDEGGFASNLLDGAWGEVVAPGLEAPFANRNAMVSDGQATHPSNSIPNSGRRRKTLSAITLVFIAGGTLAAGSLISRFPSVTQGRADRDVSPDVVGPRSAPTSSFAVAPTASPNPSVVISAEGSRPPEIAAARPSIHRGAGGTRVRGDLGRHRPREIVARKPANPEPRRLREDRAMAIATVPPNIRERSDGSAIATPPNVRLRPEYTQRVVAAGDHPATSQRLLEYRASQAEYERQLKAYEQAMARYHERVVVERPSASVRSTDPDQALDSLPWRR